MNISLPENSKFACFSIHNCSLAEDLFLPFELGKNTYAIGELPFSIEDHWKEQLGLIRTEEFMDSNFFLICFMSSENPECLDHENTELEKNLLSMFYTLFLQGIPYYKKAILASGTIKAETLQIRQFTPFDWHAEINPLIDSISISPDSLKFAYKSGKALLKINSEEGKYIRIRKGFNAWKSGIGDPHQYGDARLHQFVRAAEGFLKLKEGEARKNFIHRANLLSRNDKKTRIILEEIYNLRSCAEHLNEFDEVLSSYPENERQRIGLIRTHQAELLASHIYKKLLTEPDFLKNAEDDNVLESFWNQDDRAILNAWGSQIDLFFIPSHGKG